MAEHTDDSKRLQLAEKFIQPNQVTSVKELQ